MDERVAALFNELKQICEQYRAEVPSRRRAWPQSIKKRIFELRRLGVGAGAVAEATLIPVQTIYSWQNRKDDRGSFLPVPVVKRRTRALTAKTPSVAPTVTDRKRRRRLEKSFDGNHNPTVTATGASCTACACRCTVVTPSGYRLEGLSYAMVRELLAAVEAGGGR